MSREELKSRLKISPRLFNPLLRHFAGLGLLVESESLVASPAHQVRFDSGQQSQVDSLLRKFAQNPYAPPTIKECKAEVGDEIFNAMLEMELIIAVSAEIVFRKQDYDLMVKRIREAIQARGQISLAEARDLFETSRKYVQALLEHLDSIGVTLRAGDYRKLRH